MARLEHMLAPETAVISTPSSRVRSMIAMSMVLTMPMAAERKKMKKKLTATKGKNVNSYAALLTWPPIN